jgi:glycosyltransferase involved in cell wall biosynthesis
MKVVHLTSVHPRYDKRIYYKQLIYLAENGYDVELVVNDKLPDEDINNIHIYSTGKRFKNKIIRLLYSIFCFPFISIKRNAVLYHIHDPELLITGFFLTLFQRKVIYDVHENYELLLNAKKPRMLYSTLALFYRFLENLVVGSLDGIVVVNDSLYDKYVNKAKRISLITNYPIPIENIIPIAISNHPIRAIFAGGLTKNWNLELLIEAFSQLENFELWIAGEETNYFRSLDYSNRKNVKYLGNLKKSALFDVYRKCHVGLAIDSSPQSIGKGSIGVTKVYEYMSFGLPVIVNSNEVLDALVNEEKIGYLVQDYTVTELTRVLKFIASNPDIHFNNSNNSIRIINEKYNWNLQFTSLNNLYKEILCVE